MSDGVLINHTCSVVLPVVITSILTLSLGDWEGNTAVEEMIQGGQGGALLATSVSSRSSLPEQVNGHYLALSSCRWNAAVALFCLAAVFGIVSAKGNKKQDKQWSFPQNCWKPISDVSIPK